jgi:hypothetical protein
MKRCLACDCLFSSQDWRCQACNNHDRNAGDLRQMRHDIINSIYPTQVGQARRQRGGRKQCAPEKSNAPRKSHCLCIWCNILLGNRFQAPSIHLGTYIDGIRAGGPFRCVLCSNNDLNGTYHCRVWWRIDFREQGTGRHIVPNWHGRGLHHHSGGVRNGAICNRSRGVRCICILRSRVHANARKSVFCFNALSKRISRKACDYFGFYRRAFCCLYRTAKAQNFRVDSPRRNNHVSSCCAAGSHVC